MIPRKVLLNVRLTNENNDRLRNLTRYRGDLSANVERALCETDLLSVTVDDSVAIARNQVIFTLNKPVAELLGKVSEGRCQSRTAIVNAALSAWLSRADV